MRGRGMDIFISKKMRNFILLAQTNNIARAAEKIHMFINGFLRLIMKSITQGVVHEKL